MIQDGDPMMTELQEAELWTARPAVPYSRATRFITDWEAKLAILLLVAAVAFGAWVSAL